MPCEKGAIFSSLPKTNRGSPTVLKGDPKGKNFLYTNGTSVFIRDIENPAISDVYTQHAHNATVAVYAPSGFYIASADSAGKVRIWDTTQAEHILKYEYQPLGGPIKDIAWSPDSKRIVVAGEGREKFGHVFLWDTGASVGDVNGHSKSINAVDYRPERPFRIVTASEDTEVGFFAGPPFKFHHLNKGHTNFVNCVKYSPDGSLFASGGADGKIYIYDGKEGDNGVSLGGERAHKGGIYGLSWSGDGKKLLSASADKTAKIWDIATETASTEFTFGNTIDDQQLGCLWQGDYLLTVSLSACINYLDVNNPSRPRRILAGHNKNILSLASTADGSTLYTGSFDSRICQWNVQSGEAKIFKGKGHTNQVSDMALCGENFLVTCSMDDTVRLTDLQTLEYGSCAFTLKDFDHPVEGTPEKDCWQDWHHFNLKMTSAQDVEPSVTSKGPSQDSFDPDDQIPQRYAGMGSQPRGVASGKDDLVVVACIKEVAVLREGNPVFSLPVDYEPLCVAVHPGQTEVAVGGMTKYVYIYTLESNTLVEKTKLELTVNVMSVWALAYSPDGAWLATGDNDKKVNIFDSVKNSKKNYLEAHNARVTCLAWSPDSRLLASGGLDTNIFIYNMDDKSKSKMEIKGAHPQGVISRISWLSNNRLVSVGHDCCVRFWTVTE